MFRPLLILTSLLVAGTLFLLWFPFYFAYWLLKQAAKGVFDATHRR